MTVKLHDIAHARTGDKGDTSTISLIAYDPRHYAFLERQVTVERVKAHFAALRPTSVDRFELPGLSALNFVIKGVLGGGVTRSLALDPHGKTLSSLLLELELDAALELEPPLRVIDGGRSQ